MFSATDTWHNNRLASSDVKWWPFKAYQQITVRCRRPLGVRGKVLQCTNAVFPRKVALEVRLEDFETFAVPHIRTVPRNVEARRVRLVDDEGIWCDDKSEPIHSSTLINCQVVHITSYTVELDMQEETWHWFYITNKSKLTCHQWNI